MSRIAALDLFRALEVFAQNLPASYRGCASRTGARVVVSNGFVPPRACGTIATVIVFTAFLVRAFIYGLFSRRPENSALAAHAQGGGDPPRRADGDGTT